MTYHPTIIIGAARSGTNMLRDTLTSLPKIDTWPCDEINYVWRHGNITEPTDELTPKHATPQVKTYLHKSFNHIATKYTLDFVVEKTCANSLRLGFVHEIFPEAKYLVLIRDGRDVVASALKRWVAPFDLTYTLKKARFVPLSDLPYYGFQYIRNRWHRLTSDEKRVASWGPKFEGMQKVLNSHSLAEVCALQWQKSVNNTERDLAQMAKSQIYKIRYEDFVQNPAEHLKEITDFLGYELQQISVESLTDTISTKSIGKWKQDLTAEQQEAVHKILAPTLQFYGYT